MGEEIQNRTEENLVDDVNMEKNMNDDKIVQELIVKAETLENGKSLSEKKKRKKKKKRLEVAEDGKLESSCVDDEDPVVAEVGKVKSLGVKDKDLVIETEASTPQHALTPTESEETEKGKSLPESKKRKKKKKREALEEVAKLKSSCVEDPVAEADDTTPQHAVTPSESEESISKKKKKLKRSASEANIDTIVSNIIVAPSEGKTEILP